MERINRKPADLVLIVDLVLLLGIGVVVLFSASAYYAERVTGNPYFYLKRQIVWIVIGLFVGIIASLTPLDLLRRITPMVVFLSLSLLLMTFIPGLSRPVLGARRWIFIFGQSFEPSELVKFAVVLYLAYILDKKKVDIDPVNTILPPAVLVSLFLALIYLQNDFSTAFFILFIAVAMFFIAEVKILYFMMLGVVVVPLGILLLFTREHRVKRLIAFLDPMSDPAGTGYQVIAARSALINGGILGKGLSLGEKKMGGLPEAHSDFIFAVIGEEMGFIGAIAIISLFLVVAWRGYTIAYRAEDKFIKYLAFGISTLIVFQAFLNMAVVTGLVPATGITLPYFSSGGSSLVVTLLMTGVLLRLSREADGADRRKAYG